MKGMVAAPSGFSANNNKDPQIFLKQYVVEYFVWIHSCISDPRSIELGGGRVAVRLEMHCP